MVKMTLIVIVAVKAKQILQKVELRWRVLNLLWSSDWRLFCTSCKCYLPFSQLSAVMASIILLISTYGSCFCSRNILEDIVKKTWFMSHDEHVVFTNLHFDFGTSNWISYTYRSHQQVLVTIWYLITTLFCPAFLFLLDSCQTRLYCSFRVVR